MLVSTDHGIIDSETGLPPVDNVEAPAYPAEAQATFDAKVEERIAGIYPPCSAFEAWFVSTALDDNAFERIAEALNADEAPLAPPPPPPAPPV